MAKTKPMNPAAVSLQNVTVQFDGNVILDSINLTVKPESIISIVGPNGGGKTTLLNTILGLIRPLLGTVQVFGRSPSVTGSKGFFGYLPQGNHSDLNFPVNVFDVVAMSRYSQKSYFQKLNKNDTAIIKKSLNTIEMTEFSHTSFGQLSGGQQQRVLIARALAMEPRILILDEPSTGLDTVAQDQFYCMLERIRDEQGMTIIMVSHDIGAVSSIVDQIACLNRKIHFHGNPRKGIPDSALEAVFGKNIQFVYHDHHCRTCEDHP